MILVALAAAVLATGVAGTLAVLWRAGGSATRVSPALWPAFAVAALLASGGLGLRGLRWVFLLRRADTRIPIRDAFIGYFSGLSLLLVPFLIGEVAVRGIVLRRRADVPIATTCLVNVWERALDLAALALIGGAAGTLVQGPGFWYGALLGLACATVVRPVRVAALSVAASIADGLPAALGGGRRDPGRFAALATDHNWAVALATSVAAWILPALGFWLIARSAGTLPPGDAIHSYAVSAVSGGLVLAPGGVIVAGTRLLTALHAHGYAPADAAVLVLATRVATLGLATALGFVFVGVHLASRRGDAPQHFDALAHAYDVQIPEARRVALLDRKTALMKAAIDARGVGRRGLDVGCGQGWYVARMRELGFDVHGIDDSMGQVQLARGHVSDPSLIEQGSALAIPAPDASCDFMYTINVLHHLSSIEDQRRAFDEMFRVLRPGGLLFVHEINTRNLLFRFYMGYVFPSLNCIDEGVERWLLPHRLDTYTTAPVVETRYFTFLPEFLPAGLLRLFAPLERRLERSALRPYSAHYMAVLQKPA